MAQNRLTITIDAEAAHDAFDELATVHRRLAARHGERFRDLDRSIELLMDDPGEIEIVPLGPGTFAYIVPGVADILAQARRLGV